MSTNTENTISTRSEPPLNVLKGYFSLGSLAYHLSLSSVISGFCFGYDSGIISNAMLYIVYNENMQPMTDLWNSFIVSTPAGAAAFGALLAGPISDFFGRKKTIMLSCIFEIIGCILCAFSFQKLFLVIGRGFLGLALGLSSVATPVYIAESSPAKIRGCLVTFFQFMITFGFFFSSIAGGVFSYVNPINVGWRLMLGLTAAPAAFELVCLLYLPESPRWQFVHGHQEAAINMLRCLYGNHKTADFEITELVEAYENEKRARQFIGADSWVLMRVFKTRYVLRALAVGSLNHIFQQLAGINVVMYYAGTLFQAAGVRGNHSVIWISAAVTGVNFIATLIPLFLIERFGRRPFLLVSVGAAIITLCLTATFFLLININSISTISIEDTIGGFNFFKDPDVFACMSIKNCDYCVNTENCGFCRQKDDMSFGYCLPWDRNTTLNQYWSTVGPCAGDYNKDLYEWEDAFCRTRFTIITLLCISLYIVFFAIGFAPIPWIANAEYYPYWARTTCAGIATFFNWGATLLVSLSYLNLVTILGKYGIFYIYAGITVVAMAFIYFFVPETKAITLEKVETLFMTGRERHLISYIYNLHNMERSVASINDEDHTVQRL